MKVGNIVYFDNLVFSDGVKDDKKRRPCIVLANYDYNDKKYLFCVPVTSSIRSFNKKNYNHMLIPEPIYNYKKLCFAKIDNLFMQEEVYANYTNIILGDVSMNQIKRKIMEYPSNNLLYQIMRDLINIEKLDSKKSKKLQKNIDFK